MDNFNNIAWFAGMFDGEGCLSMCFQKKGTTQLAISVTNTSMEALNLFLNRFGGKIYHSHKTKTPCFRWQIWGRDNIKNFLESILPYSVIKKSQIELVLKYLKTVKDANKYFGKNNRLTPEVITYRQDVLRKLSKRTGNYRNQYS